MFGFIKCFFCGHKWKYVDIFINESDPEDENGELIFNKKCKNCQKKIDKRGNPVVENKKPK